MKRFNIITNSLYILYGLFALVLLGCKAAQATEAVESISVIAQSRGVNTKYVIDKSAATCFRHDKMAYRDKQPEVLETFRSTLPDLNQLADLETSKKMSASDRSPIAYLVVKTDKATYESPRFDFFNPPAELQALISKLEEMDEKYD